MHSSSLTNGIWDLVFAEMITARSRRRILRKELSGHGAPLLSGMAFRSQKGVFYRYQARLALKDV